MRGIPPGIWLSLRLTPGRDLAYTNYHLIRDSMRSDRRLCLSGLALWHAGLPLPMPIVPKQVLIGISCYSLVPNVAEISQSRR
jgi:hypothetical protein